MTQLLSARFRWAGAIVALLLAGVVGYTLGHSDHGAEFHTDTGLAYAGPNGGTAYLGRAQRPNRAPTGFAYLLPARVPWVDANGTINDGDRRPVCLPYYHAVRVRMETVKFPIAGGYQGTVLWVRC
ncbi:MAG: hypothetical protein WBQ18_03595 [Solirubrobacteraceae bacterium]